MNADNERKLTNSALILRRDISTTDSIRSATSFDDVQGVHPVGDILITLLLATSTVLQSIEKNFSLEQAVNGLKVGT